jgi:hypothetical protein
MKKSHIHFLILEALLTDGGVPRLPSYVGIRAPIAATVPIPYTKALSVDGTRRFQFVGGSSAKSWEIAVAGNDGAVCYGRTGSKGQTNTKSFGDDADANKHADKLIEGRIPATATFLSQLICSIAKRKHAC